MEISCMILNMRKLLYITCILLSSPLFSQNMGQHHEEGGFGPGMVQHERTGDEIVFFEIHYILTNSDSQKVEALYRLREDFFTFVRDGKGDKEVFTASGEAAIEILDSTDNSIARQIKAIELSSETNTTQELRKKYLQSRMSFRLPSGKYKVLLSIEDKESKRVLPDIKKPLHIHSVKQHSRSPLIPVAAEQQSDSSFRSFNLSGDVEFSKDFGFLFVSSDKKLHTARYTIKKFSLEDEEQVAESDTTVQCTIYPSSSLSTSERNGEVYFVHEPDSNSTVYYIPVNGIILKQGRYEIEVTFADSLKTKTMFAARWLSMPMSLNDLDLAIYPLQHIMTKEDYSDLNSGIRQNRIKKFEEFWKKKDPTPNTAYNEVMAEFYRRVDYAITAYRTLKETNGSLTDRGRIYILYGKPTTTERILNPGESPREIWKYISLKKTFVFEDKTKQGNYRLAESK